MRTFDLVAQQVEEVASRQRAGQRIVARLGREQGVGRLQLFGKIARGAMVAPLAHVRHGDHPRERHGAGQRQKHQQVIALVIAQQFGPGREWIDQMRRQPRVQAAACLIQRGRRLLAHAEQLSGHGRGHPGCLFAYLRVDLNLYGGKDFAEIDGHALGGAHLRDGRVRQCVAFERAVVRHDDDAVFIGDEGAGVRDPVAQPRDPHLGHHGADQQAVGVHRRGDEDARLAARAAHAIGFRKRAE